jgi:thiol-disulfide isomerase/thioredoxin
MLFEEGIMNKKLLSTVLVIILFIGGGLAFLLLQKDETKKESRPNTSTDESVTPVEEATTQTTEEPGKYIDYKADAISTTSGTKLLFFHAPWCPQCRALETDILDEGVPSGVTIFKTDYDTNQALRQKYGVTIQTTFVEVDENGDLIEKFVAYDDPTLASVEENLLQ